MSRKKLVSLATRRVAPHPDVIAGLTDLLDRAKRGEIRGYAFAISADAGCDATACIIGDGTIPTLVCAIERVKLRLLAHEGEG